MSKLDIPGKGVGDIELVYLISDWLAKSKKRYTLPLAFDHPNKPWEPIGILFITCINLCKSKIETPSAGVEAGKYIPVVKNWMVNEGGLETEDLT